MPVDQELAAALEDLAEALDNNGGSSNNGVIEDALTAGYGMPELAASVGPPPLCCCSCCC